MADATPGITDSTGRTVDVQLTAKAVVDLLLANTSNEVLKVNVVQADETNDMIEQVTDAVEQLDQNVRKDLKDIHQILQDLFHFFQKNRGTAGGTVPTSSKQSGDGGGTNTTTSGRKRRRTVAEAATGDLIPPSQGGGGPLKPPSGGTTRSVQPKDGAGGGPAITTAAKSLALLNVGMQKLAAATATVLNDFGVNLSGIFSGVVGDSVRWQVYMSQVAWEQRGINSQLSETKKQYIEIGEVVAETGFNRTAVQEQITKQLRQGMTMEMTGGKMQTRNLGQVQRMVKNTMVTANMIGSDVGQTVEMFGEWNRHLGMTNNQLSNVGLSMQQIGHITGVTGDNLLKAAQTASQVGKEVFKYSGISDRAMANLIQQQAAFSKYGIGDIATKIQTALSGGISTFAQADPKMQAWMARSAGSAGIGQSELMSGAANDPVVMNKIMDSMMGDASNFLKSSGMSGNLESLTTELQKIQNINPRRAMQLREQIQNIFGVGAGGLQQMAKAQKEASMTPEQRIAELQKQKDTIDPNAAGSKARIQSIDQQMRTIKSTANRQTLSQFQTESQAAGGDVNKALQNMNAQREKDLLIKNPSATAAEIAATRIDAGGLQNIASQTVKDLGSRAKKAGVDVNAELSKAGVSSMDELAKGLTGPNAETMNEVLQRIENQVQTGERAESDPILKLQLKVNQINEYLKTLVEFFTSGLGFAALTAVVAGLGALSLSSGVSAVSSASSLASWLLPSAAGAAGTAGAGAAAGAGTAGAGAAAGAAGGLSATGVGAIVVAAAAAVLAATGAVVQGFQTGAEAAEIFGVAQENLTLRQKNAAEGAGVLSGALNWLTFGIFNKSLGPTSDLTKSLAIFFDKFWILGSIFSLVTNSVRVVWGVIKGFGVAIWEIFKGIWDAVMMVVDPIINIFSELWNAISEPLAELFDIFGGGNDVLADSVDIVGSIVSTFKMFGQAIGWFFKAFGFVLGWIIKEATPSFVSVFQMLGSAIKSLVPLVENLWNASKAYFGGLWDVLAGIFTLDFVRVWEGLKSMFLKTPVYVGKAFLAIGELLIKAIWNSITALPSLIWNRIKGLGIIVENTISGIHSWFKWLYNELYGNSIVPDLVEGIIKFFMMLPIKILSALVNFGFDMLKMIGGWIGGIPGMIINNLADIGNWLWNSFVEALGGIGDWLYDTFISPFVDIGTTICGMIVDGLQGIGEVIMGVFQGFTETREEAAARREREGDSAAHGFGNTVGGAWQMMSLKPSNWIEGGGRILDGLGETASAVGSSIGNFFSSINPFALGTQQIEQPGLGLLHAGEAVIPAPIWQQMQSMIAEGNSFGSGGGILGSIESMLGLNDSSSVKNGIANPANLGAFAEDQIIEAQIFANENMISIMTFASDIKNLAEAGIKTMGSVAAANMGAFDPSAIQDAFVQVADTTEKELLFGLNTESEGMFREFDMERLEQQVLAALGEDGPLEVIVVNGGSKSTLESVSSGSFGSMEKVLGSFAENSLTSFLSNDINALSSILDTAESSSTFSESGGILSTLDRFVSSFSGSNNTVSSMMQNLGLFSNSQIEDARENADTNTISSMFSRVTDSVMSSPLAQALTSSLGGLNETSRSTDSSMLSMGLFDPSNISNLASSYIESFMNAYSANNNSETSNILSRFFGSGDINTAFDNIASTIGNTMMGASNATRSLYVTEGEEYGSSLVSKVMSYFDSREDNSEKKGTASTTSAFNYNEDGSIGGGIVNSLSNAFSSAFMPKGKAQTSMFTTDTVEDNVAQQVYGSRPQGATALVPGMDGILNYLSGDHDKKLEELVDIMTILKDFMMKSGPSDILLADNTKGVPSTDRSGIRNWAKGRISGQWVGDQDNAYQPQQNVSGDSMT